MRAVYLIHDLIPLTHPQFCRPGENRKHEKRIENALASASGVITNSQDTMMSLARFAATRGRSLPATLVAWIAGEEAPMKVEPKDAQNPFFVTVGTIEARKNHIMLLGIWKRLVARMEDNAPDLIIVGQRGWEAEQTFRRLDDLGVLAGKVREINDCEDSDLASWIASARALLMPSFAEGFGLPIIEALNLGTPVIASDLAVFREIAGNVPTYLDPTDESAWEHAIESFSERGPEYCRQMSQIASYKTPSWIEHFTNVEKWMAT
jgi:glycosyltransferase involved in cell wall biosynthesis